MSCPPRNNNCLNSPTTACDKYIAGKCITYSGPALCTGIVYNDSIDTAIKKISDKICQIQTGSGSSIPRYLQFVVGESDSPMNEGDTTLILLDDNIVEDSVWITLGGPELPRGRTDRQSYGVQYALNQATINFYEGVADGNLFIVHYDVGESIEDINTQYGFLQFTVGDPLSNALFSGNKAILSLPADGSNVLIINQGNVKSSRVQLFWDGNLMLPYRTDRESYEINATGNSLTLTRTGVPFTNGQSYTLFYAYS